MNTTAPYNFVPLNKPVYIPEWWDKVSMDVPFSDGEDGVIEVCATTVSPLFIRNGSPKSKPSQYSANVSEDSDPLKQYFIPGTSLKGMIASALEVLSFGRMNQYNDDYFGYRIFNTDITDGKDYVNKTAGCRCGWLRLENDKYILTPCKGKFEKIPCDEVKKSYPEYRKEDPADKKQAAVSDETGLYPLVEDEGIQYRLVCTGPMNNKKHEYLFPTEEDREIQLTDEEKKEFLSIHKPTPLFKEKGYFRELLQKGESIPVFFVRDDRRNNQLCIGLSRMIRFPYKNKVSDAVRQENHDGLDLAKTIFGYISNNGGQRGRVQVGHAMVDRLIADTELKYVNGVLGAPKASYYPFYIRQSGQDYHNYNNTGVEIAGRKRYRIHKGDTVTDLPEGNGNENVETEFKALPAGLNLTFRINIHNLRPVEIGAILSALTFHGMDNCWHNIGLAKAYGYGKLVCTVKNLKNLEKTPAEYMRLFEEEMSDFTYNNMRKCWHETEQVKTLFAIASEHDNATVRVMTLKEYGDSKRNNNFSMLTERSVSPIHHVNEEDIEVRSHVKKAYGDADELEKQGYFDSALVIYEDLSDYLTKRDRSTDEVTKKIEDCRKKKCEQERKALAEEEERKRQAEAARQKRQSEKSASGLAFLVELYPNGKWKVGDWKGAKGRIEKWLKDTGEEKIPGNQYEYIDQWLTHTYGTLNNRDKKDWDNKNSRMWQVLEAWTDADQAKKWYNMIIPTK